MCLLSLSNIEGVTKLFKWPTPTLDMPLRASLRSIGFKMTTCLSLIASNKIISLKSHSIRFSKIKIVRKHGEFLLALQQPYLFIFCSKVEACKNSLILITYRSFVCFEHTFERLILLFCSKSYMF